ncbi:MAG: DUF349 domain-containing protein [Bacteroidota bacterium]|nr:DUF349 domain-containing protein [Bacteroidota bacterium]
MSEQTSQPEKEKNALNQDAENAKKSEEKAAVNNDAADAPEPEPENKTGANEKSDEASPEIPGETNEPQETPVTITSSKDASVPKEDKDLKEEGTAEKKSSAAEEEVAAEEEEEKEAAAEEKTSGGEEASEKEETKAKEETPGTEKPEEEEESGGDQEESDEEEDEDEIDDETSKQTFDEMSRQELVEVLEETVKESDISKIKTRVSLIKVAYLSRTSSEQQEKIEENIEIKDEEGESAEEKDALQERFDMAFSVYRQNKSQYTKKLEKKKQENLEFKKQILEDLKELINSEETLKNTYDQFRELQEKWKEIGMVPRSEVNNLWQSYHFLVEKFFDKVKINKELRDLDLKKNLEAKIELCEKAEELLLETSIIRSFKELQKLHEKFKEIGPAPQDKKDEVWERFKSATDKINDRRREHYAQLTGQQEGNLEAKTALCVKAEELLGRKNEGMKDWQENTRQMNELFKVWKTIGPAPKKHNDEIWSRFRSSLNTFFENRREFFNQVKEQQLNNYNLKLDLCAQAEAVQDNADWRKTTEDLIRLQKEWKKIGPVPRKNSDKIWKRFRAANDHFFKKKSEYFSNIHEHEAKNLEDKKALIGEVKNYSFGDDKKENLKVIKEFQRRWMDVGHVPIKEKDSIQNEFRKVIDAQMEKLKISTMEISQMAYKNKVENLKDDPNARKALGRERNFLNGKISKLREDIHLWENNVGFLASSKKADILKNEFMKKIDKAKQDLKVFEAKLKYLNTQD